MNFIWFFIFPLFVFFTAILYFYLFSKQQERFMQFWGFSWIAYSCSLLCMLIYFNTESELLLVTRKVVDMANLLLLLFGSYSYAHLRTPTYWYRFSLYLLLLTVICVLYDMELLSFYLPISTYQLIITLFICYNIWKRWDLPRRDKTLSIAIFLMWGIDKSSFSIVEVFTDITIGFYFSEVMLSNIVNFCILVICIMHTHREDSLANDLYKTVVDNSRDAIFYYKLKPYSAFEYVSPSIEDVTGFPQYAFYSDPAVFTHMAEGQRQDKLRDIFSGNAPDQEPVVLEMMNRQGDPFWGEFTYNVLRNDQNEPIAVEGTFRDITKIRSAQLERINATKSRNLLLSYISHELRTPITSIAGYLTAIEDGTISSDEERNEAMEIITAKAMTLKKLIDDLDQLTKLETNQFTFEFILSNAGEVTENLVNSGMADAREAGFSVTMNYDIYLLHKYWIVIDEDRINQVFNNLITNAIKYSGDNRELFISFDIDDSEDSFVVSVTDHGIGIKEANLPHVFNRFYRAENDEQQAFRREGRGLGLTLCKEIMAAHQGDIYVDSTYGSGSTFTFIIPLYKEA